MSEAQRLVCRTQALVLAGGQGERLHPLTVSRAKPAVPFGHGRIIDASLANCQRSGLDRVLVLTQYERKSLEDYIQQTWVPRWTKYGPANLQCLAPRSGRRYRGTADAVFQNIPTIESADQDLVLILSGDHVYDMDYVELIRHHIDSGADTTVAAVEQPAQDAKRFGVMTVDRDLRVTRFEEKPTRPAVLPGRPDTALINMGVYVFNKTVLIRELREHCGLPGGADFGRDVIPDLIRSARVYAFNFQDTLTGAPRYWRDIGTLDSYYQASLDLLGRGTAGRPDSFDYGESTASPVHVSSGAFVSRSILSSGTHIDAGARVEEAVLMPDVTIGRGARVRRAIVEDGVVIPAGFRVGFDVEVDRRLHVVTPGGVVVVAKNTRWSVPVAERVPEPERALPSRSRERTLLSQTVASPLAVREGVR